ncbi:MAG: nicotinate-nucleotide--dimethylbenzimidazole phosphoribosyltransferase [Treponemataceae bacterium]|nr:nicotinate-nucleotide--dimethylbenzimidazole phosphoribosyltransferase [Treponemataceae bacterium]
MSENNETSPFSLEQAMQAHLDNLTKPKGSLGKLENYALTLARIQRKVPPRIRKKAVFVFAGDHGITQEGVSLYPPEVTAQMVHNFMGGGAAINVFARHCGFDVYAVDAGVQADFPSSWQSTSQKEYSDIFSSGQASPRFIPAKIVRGTRNFYKEPALTETEFTACLEKGKELARCAHEHSYDLVALGDMGIGNTSSAAAMAVAFGFNPEDIIDRGTGISDTMLAHKYKVITEAVSHFSHQVSMADPAQIGAFFGGAELVMTAGFILGLEGKNIACVIDGFPITSAALLAYKMNPRITDWLFAGHRSHVKGHGPLLNYLGLDPIVQLDMRLGEGTGAVIGGFILSLSTAIANEMASFSQAGVSTAPQHEQNY